MDETIGVKGGHQDHIRTMRIDREQKRKLKEYQEEKEIQELEKEVKKKQRMILIKALPIAIAGEIFQVLYEGATGKKPIDKEEEYSKWRIKEYDADFTTKTRDWKAGTREKVITLSDGTKVTIMVPITDEKKMVVVNGEEVKEIPIPFLDKNEERVEQPTVEEKRNPFAEKPNTLDGVLLEPFKREERDQVDSLEDELSPKSQETLGKLKNRKIIDEYERQLKDIRFELRNLVFEYTVLEEDADSMHFSEEAERLLDRLRDVIRKIEILKEKIHINHLEDFDDNYIYTLIEGYLSEFQDKKLVDSLKDSPLYVEISQKIDEISGRKDKFQKDVEDKKKEYEEKEKRFDELKDKYYSFESFNRELASFQEEQEILLREVRDKVANSLKVSERVEVQVQALNHQSRRLLRLLTLSMFLPGNRSAKKLAAATASYLLFARNLLRPETTTRRYQVITVQDYSSDIEYSISEIENASDLLKRTDKQVDRIIQEIRHDFHDYIGFLPECDELLANLEKVKSDIHEKESCEIGRVQVAASII